MSAVDRDPVIVAREVLDMNDARDYLATADPLAVYSVGGDRYAGIHMSEKIERRLLEASPTLARAVIDLTAQLDAERFAHANTAVKVKGAEALADKLDREASEYLGRPVHSQAGDRIRAALSGETDG